MLPTVEELMGRGWVSLWLRLRLVPGVQYRQHTVNYPRNRLKCWERICRGSWSLGDVRCTG